jgi:hypothetical protein
MQRSNECQKIISIDLQMNMALEEERSCIILHVAVMWIFIFFFCPLDSILEDPTDIPEVYHSSVKLIFSCLQKCSSFALGKQSNRISL